MNIPTSSPTYRLIRVTRVNGRSPRSGHRRHGRTHTAPPLLSSRLSTAASTARIRIWRASSSAGWDVVANAALPAGNSDVMGHGTRVAGVIGAKTSNGAAAGESRLEHKVMPVRAADRPATSPRVRWPTGIRWATDHGAQVINLSLGSPCGDRTRNRGRVLRAGAQRSRRRSAGNDQQDGNRVMYPAALTGVVAVAATGRDGTRAWYSNSGSYVSIAAPGGSADGNAADDVPVLVPGGSTTTSAGTSFAAPLVAAAAALVMAERPDLLRTRCRRPAFRNRHERCPQRRCRDPPRRTPRREANARGVLGESRQRRVHQVDADESWALGLSKDGTVRALGDVPGVRLDPFGQPGRHLDGHADGPWLPDHRLARLSHIPRRRQSLRAGHLLDAVERSRARWSHASAGRRILARRIRRRHVRVRRRPVLRLDGRPASERRGCRHGPRARRLGLLGGRRRRRDLLVRRSVPWIDGWITAEQARRRDGGLRYGLHDGRRRWGRLQLR